MRQPCQPGSRDGDAAAVNGFYRLIEHPDDSPVTVEAILTPHRERTLQRMRSQDTVLCIQDGTDLNFATRPGCSGLEVIGRNQTGTGTLGLYLHATLAVSGRGLPLGVLRCGFDNAVEVRTNDPNRNRRKKTQRWIDGFDDTVKLARELTRSTRVISVCDREGDFFELFDKQRSEGRVELLVRAKHDRRRGGWRVQGPTSANPNGQRAQTRDLIICPMGNEAEQAVGFHREVILNGGLLQPWRYDRGHVARPDGACVDGAGQASFTPPDRRRAPGHGVEGALLRLPNERLRKVGTHGTHPDGVRIRLRNRHRTQPPARRVWLIDHQ